MRLERVLRAAAIVALVGCGGQAPPRPQDAPDRPSSDTQAREPQARQRPQAPRRGQQAAGRTARVIDVIDGDTIELQGVGRVRLIGVDTPERGEECYQQATDYLRSRVGAQTVRYRYQQERQDRYDRALLDIFAGAKLVNLDIAQAGWGEELTIAPNDRYAQPIAQAEADARAEPRGRWAGCLGAPEPQLEPEPTPAPPPGDKDDDSPGDRAGGSLPPPPPDLDCSDLDGPLAVGPDDPHRLDADGDGDGDGCE